MIKVNEFIGFILVYQIWGQVPMAVHYEKYDEALAGLRAKLDVGELEHSTAVLVLTDGDAGFHICVVHEFGLYFHHITIFVATGRTQMPAHIGADRAPAASIDNFLGLVADNLGFIGGGSPLERSLGDGLALVVDFVGNQAVQLLDAALILVYPFHVGYVLGKVEILALRMGRIRHHSRVGGIDCGSRRGFILGVIRQPQILPPGCAYCQHKG